MGASAASTGSVLPRVVSAVVLALWPSRIPAGEQVLRIDPLSSQVVFHLDATLHTARGTIAVKSGTIRFDVATGAASGAVVLDATSADTRHTSRDKKMHREVLESAAYPEIVFRPTGVAAEVDARGVATVSLTGAVTIHGGDHPATVTAAVQRAGGTIRATGKLAVPYVAWGLTDPSAFLLRVAKEVEVTFTVAGVLEDAEPPTGEAP